MCFYKCDDIDLKKSSLNTYYLVAQKILNKPETEIVVLGSSRGQTIPPLWIEHVTGLRALNLSMGGAELSAKTAFLNIALEKTKLTHVLWFADYFELTSEIADNKIKKTKALTNYLIDDAPESGLTKIYANLTSLIDHNTLEASLYALKHPKLNDLDHGAASEVDYKKCLSNDYRGEKSQRELDKEIGFTYDSYTKKILKPKQSEKSWSLFLKKLNQLSEKKIKVAIVITPYNPYFLVKLKSQFPEIYNQHQTWISRLTSLKIPYVTVLNFFNGIPGDDKSNRFWNDGVHFTCLGSIEMLKLYLRHEKH